MSGEARLVDKTLQSDRASINCRGRKCCNEIGASQNDGARKSGPAYRHRRNRANDGGLIERIWQGLATDPRKPTPKLRTDY